MIPLFKPYMPKLPELDTILHSGKLSNGTYTREFEIKLAEYLGIDYVAVTNSYPNALLVALTTLGLRAGDEVILSPMACLVSTQPLLAAGFQVRWADIDPLTGTLSPESVKIRITEKTKAIIHYHFCGYLGHIDAINQIGKEFHIPVIDDGFEAFGGEYKGKMLGNLGSDATLFSFNSVRILNTLDGGAVCFHNRDLYQKSLLIRDNGIDRKKFRDEIGEIDPLCDIPFIGYNATMSNINAYIGLEQLKVLPELLAKQRKNARRWDDLIKRNHPELKTMTRPEINPNYWVYGILADRKKETIHAFRNRGFYASGVHVSNHLYSVFSDHTEYNGVTEFNDRFVALPCGWWMDDVIDE